MAEHPVAHQRKLRSRCLLLALSKLIVEERLRSNTLLQFKATHFLFFTNIATEVARNASKHHADNGQQDRGQDAGVDHGRLDRVP